MSLGAALIRQRPLASSDSVWRLNNFDLIRLFAALQVATVHIIGRFRPGSPWVAILEAGLRLFPGVPIFFLVSGVLISRSYEGCASLRTYYRNRCLRIFPALWVCLVVSLGVIVLTIDRAGPIDRREWLLWWLGQMTLAQQYSPSFLHGDRLNGSLWTIPVELEFYLLLPLLYALARLRGRGRNWPFVCVLAVSAAIHWVLLHAQPGSVAIRYVFVWDTVIPYLWMFLTGVLIQRNWTLLRPWLAGQFHWWLLGYILVFGGMRLYFRVGVGSIEINLLFLIPLAGVVMSCATSVRSLSERVLAGNDISYGVYIYHMLVVAVLLHFGFRHDLLTIALAVAAAVCVGYLSWCCVERPFLRQKHNALRAVGGAKPVDLSGLSDYPRSTG